MNLLTFLFTFVGLAMFIVCSAWIIAELKYRKFNDDCSEIEALIRKLPITIENYKELKYLVHQLNCLTDWDIKRKKALWVSIEFKFKAVSEMALSKEQLLKICAG